MDDYKTIIYNRDKKRWKNVIGIPSKLQFDSRQKCRPFSYFINNVAIDIGRYAPLKDPPAHANGLIRNPHYNLCLVTLGNSIHSQIGVSKCDDFNDVKSSQQNWEFTWYKDIRPSLSLSNCLEVTSTSKKLSPIWMMKCHTSRLGQGWIYDRASKLLINEANGRRCLDLDPIEERVFISTCKAKNVNMQWEWSFLNETAMDGFFDDEEFLQRE